MADRIVKRLKAKGFTIAGTAFNYQINPSFGGPIAKDKAWFYVTYKYEDGKVFVPSAKFADGSPAYRRLMGNYSAVGRLTVAASSKDKVRLYVEKQFNGEFYNGFNTCAVTTPEASTDAWGEVDPAGRWTARSRTSSVRGWPGMPHRQALRARTAPRSPGGGVAAPQWLDRPVERADAVI
jgi:hypothetical protein